MTNLPDPRDDGFCADCCEREAQTRDGRFCKKCLRSRIKNDTPDPRSMPSEQKGRSARSSKTLGGAPKESQ